MKSTEAKEIFRGKDKLNCVQAVLKVYQSSMGGSDEDIASASSDGGGKAEGGVCGALHAVRMLIQDFDKLRIIEQRFEAKAGSLLCKKIKKLKKLSCRDCVGLAAELVELS